MKNERLNICVNVDPLNKLKSDYSTVEFKSHVASGMSVSSKSLLGESLHVNQSLKRLSVMVLFHCVVRLGSARLSTARHGSVCVSTAV